MELTPWPTRCPLVAILRDVRPDEAEPIAATLKAHGIGSAIHKPVDTPAVVGAKAAAAGLGG